MKNEKGITLVALILIIVVLLILAGISISLVVNNEASQVVIEPENQAGSETVIEAEYDMQGFEDVNEVQDTLDEINEENANVTTVDTSITEVPENTEPVESQNAVEPEEVVE